MKKTFKTILIGAISVLVGIVATWLGLPGVKSAMDYFGPPRVTLMNATGSDISDVTISLGKRARDIPLLKDGHALTVSITGQFSECSTHVAWTDSTGRHDESAGDYMESYGFYHAKILLTPDKKAKAIYEIKESNQGIQATR
jgi:hypothetical protein